jgi:hypothetical protein
MEKTMNLWKRIFITGLFTLTCVACADTEPELGPTQNESATYKGRHVHTLTFGANDNSEVIKILPSGDKAVLVASKSRKVTLLEIGTEGITEVRTAKLFADDASDSELTHIDFDSLGSFAVVTRTQPIVDGEELVNCQGSLVFIDVSDSDSFGTVLAEVTVGAMPDAVDISPNDRFVVSADEVDFNDGKCPIEDVTPSVSLLEIPDGKVEEVSLRATITMTNQGDGYKREPEQVIIASDNEHVGVTLQDTHEVLIFRISELLSEDGSPTAFVSDDFATVTLPNRSGGAEPWPDGINVLTDALGAEYFVVAGEYNDTLTVLDLDGQVVTNYEIQPSDMPGDLPRNLESWNNAPFRPDSLASFNYGGHNYLAASLKHAGAVGVWLVDDPQNIQIAHVVKVGFDDQGDATNESTIGTEGISATSEGVILTANEKESSVSMVLPLSP